MPKLSWKKSKIFKELEKRKGAYTKDVIELLCRPEVMDSIELILDKGSTTPKDFTLHDADHSFRVANTMWDLIPRGTLEILSDFELGMLLLSAFLHDIGMSPNFETVEKHIKYISTYEKNILNEDEINEFQKWIDNEAKTKSVDIRQEIITDSELVNNIISYYVRYKHNDWSGEWIKNNLEKIPFSNYRDWCDDLIKICKSHHYGIEHLSKDIFDPKPVASNVVHIRYLSMCLRVADVMENDPERTPEVILRHRSISDRSLVYWLKDKQYILTKNGNKFSIYARPEKAYLQKAIEETAQWIEDELRLCDELIKIKPLSHSTFGVLNQYLWEIDAFLHRDISPKENTYVYIQGAFKPNTAKILELLGGNQLYGNSIWAYRELIQNSFDAVKEKIAHQIINEDKDSTIFLKALGNIYSIQIKLEKRNDGIWLICKDQGVGMTKQIIEKFFLESGSSKRHEISDLERKCKAKGFNFSRTGQFGIGVLSYFMIAEKIVVFTKRELNTGYTDEESKAWYFEINGTHDFGELRNLNSNISGTQIELKLKPEIERDIAIWNDSFISFMKTTIKYSPCTFSYSSFLEKESINNHLGWTNTYIDIKEHTINLVHSALQIHNDRDLVYSIKEKEELKKRKESANSAISGITESINFLIDEGKLEGVGKYRIHIPYFNLAKGGCFFYLKENITKNDHFLEEINLGYYWTPYFQEINVSLKGIKIDPIINPTDELSQDPDQENALYYANKTLIPVAYIEIDIDHIDESNLSVSRHELIVDNTYLLIKKHVDKKTKELIENNIHLFTNIYSAFNKTYTEIWSDISHLPFARNINTENDADGIYVTLKPITYPLGYIYYRGAPNVKFNDKVLEFITDLYDFQGEDELEWFHNTQVEYCLGMLYSKSANNDPSHMKTGIAFSIIKKIAFSQRKKFKAFLNFIDLPSEWSNILLLDSGHGDLLNKNSPLSKYYNEEIYSSINDSYFNIKLNDLDTPEKCFSFLLKSISIYTEEKWVGVCETDSKIQHIFTSLSISEILIADSYGATKISFNFWKKYYIDEELSDLRPPITDKKYLLSTLNNLSVW